MGTYAGALGAAVVGNFGAEVVDTGGRARAGATILEGMKQVAIAGEMDDGDEFLALCAAHKEVHNCTI